MKLIINCAISLELEIATFCAFHYGLVYRSIFYLTQIDVASLVRRLDAL